MGERGGLVAEGRDIGTAVFPDAELKVFLTATPAGACSPPCQGSRAPAALPFPISLSWKRRSSNATISTAPATWHPLCKAEDATELITDGMAIEAVIDALEDLFRSLKRSGQRRPG